MKSSRLRYLGNFLNLKKQQPTEGKQNNSDNIVSWGVSSRIGDNDFPQQLIQDVYNSPVGSAALEVWKEFIAGDGFVDNNQTQINKDETLQELLNKVSYDVAYMEGFAVHVQYAATGEKLFFRHVPFEQTRLGKIERGQVSNIKVNPYFGIPKDYDKKYTKTFYTFNDDPKFVKEQYREHQKLKREGKINYDYPGQIFWVSIEKPLARIYPQPFYYSGINWFRIDSEIQQFHERNLKNNFLLGSIVNIIGDPDECSGETDDNGDCKKTVGDAVAEQLKAWASGSKNGGNQWINFGKNKEEFASIEAFPTNANDTLFTALQDLTTSQIAISTKVPPILIGIQQQGKLGEAKEILNAIKVMQAVVKTKQQFISKSFTKLFRNKIKSDFNIQDIQLVNLLPEYAFDYLTVDEARKYINDNFAIKLDLLSLPIQNNYRNQLFDDYPEKSVDLAKKALDYINKNPNQSCDRINIEITEIITQKMPLNLEQVETIAKMIKFQDEKDNAYSTDCGGLQWDAYGGTQGILWANSKMQNL